MHTTSQEHPLVKIKKGRNEETNQFMIKKQRLI